MEKLLGNLLVCITVLALKLKRLIMGDCAKSHLVRSFPHFSSDRNFALPCIFQTAPPFKDAPQRVRERVGGSRRAHSLTMLYVFLLLLR